MDQSKSNVGILIKMSIIATSGMTFFSYLLSVKHKEKFLEPLALNQLLYPKNKKEQAHHTLGYLVHYLVGLFFSAFFFHIFQNKTLKPNWKNFTLLGFFNGLMGALVWYISLRLHINPPKIKLGKYFLQLVGAHVIFGVLNGLIFQWGKRK